MIKVMKKPIVVSAILFDGHNFSECSEFMLHPTPFHTDLQNQIIYIQTLDGEMAASKGDYIIKGVKGEFYPCKGDIFWETYDLVDEDGD